MDEDEKRIHHMLAAAREILDFTGGITEKEFLEKRLIQRAVEKDLEIIGEAANKVSENTKDDLSNLPWDEMIGMRNVLTHVYFDVDLQVVWKTIKEDLPPLIRKLENHLEES